MFTLATLITVPIVALIIVPAVCVLLFLNHCRRMATESRHEGVTPSDSAPLSRPRAL